MVDEESGTMSPEIEENASENSSETSQETNLELELEVVKKELEKKASRQELQDMESWKKDILKKLDVLGSEIDELREEDRRLLTQIKDFTEAIVQKNEELRKEIEGKVEDARLKSMKKDMGKMNKKLLSLMEETGFGEIIDVTKIPPNILEIVYDTTLKDISLALWREYGPGAEKVITDTLERIRLETSGSEMFHYDGRYIRTRDVAKNIKRGMISAKQLQDTYEALLKALVEFVPSYSPKNFKAMIKLKSQEYTVDKTTSLLERVEMMDERISRIDKMLSSAVAGLSSQAERISLIEEKGKENLEKRLSEEISERDARISVLERTLGGLKEEYEMSMSSLEGKMKEREETISLLLTKISEIESRLGIPDEKEEKEDKKKDEPIEIDVSSLNEEESFVLSAIPVDGVGYGKLKRSVSALISSPLDDILKSLIDKKFIDEKKKGKTRRFRLISRSRKHAEENIEEKAEEKPLQGDETRLNKILDSVPDRGCTINRLKKTLGKSMSPDEVEEMVNMLVEKGQLVKTTRGRYTVYVKKEEKGGEKDA